MKKNYLKVKGFLKKKTSLLFNGLKLLVKQMLFTLYKTTIGLLTKNERLEDNLEKYNIEYLYLLLIKNDIGTQRKYLLHMPIIHRLITISGIILFGIGIFGSIHYYSENFAVALSLLSFTSMLLIRVTQIVDANYKNMIKDMIEYKKRLEEKEEKKKVETHSIS
ncbi:hypothetical protein [Ornithinibacillus sp. JPR2-1]|uniref:hypothetical protein n=1 Tax=Ornithinibacillus sp. JPR2-1 TaxID=2094019 RepID=UPI0031D1D5ED